MFSMTFNIRLFSHLARQSGDTAAVLPAGVTQAKTKEEVVGGRHR
jgi:hypothetical protein